MAQKKVFPLFSKQLKRIPRFGMRDVADSQPTFAQFVGRYMVCLQKLTSLFSLAVWVNHPSKWIGVHRDREDKTSMRCVSARVVQSLR